jgi:uncharacterized phage protein (TIGR01671 family)
MREIKFRCWNLNQKRWECVPDCTVAGCYTLRLSDNIGDYVWQQYIGIADIDGKEIYEGDILEHSSCSRSRIEYRDGCFCLVHGHYYNDEKVGEYVQVLGHIDFLRCKPKVLGNIYENPELLKQ